MHAFNVLVVDDEPLVARALRRLLKREGFTVELAHSGEEALAMLEGFAADIVLSDFRMPGMTGSELMKQVKHRHPGVLRLILSGYADLKSVVGSMNDGEICRFMSKPWDDVELVGYLREQLAHREAMARPVPAPGACPTDASGSGSPAERTGPGGVPEQALELLARLAGPRADSSLAEVGALLERYSGTLSFAPDVGGPQRLPVALPVPEAPPAPVRQRDVGKA